MALDSRLLGACQPGAVAWIERVFSDCIYNTRDLLGFSLGLASICCWLVAQMPQLYRNYKSKSAEALSPWFLAEWLLGDTFNLLGALLKGDQPATVVFTAQYFITVDAVMMVQYIYYISLQRRRERMLAARRHRHHHHHHRRHHTQQQQQQQHSGSNGSEREGWRSHPIAESSLLSAEASTAAAAAAGGEHQSSALDGEITSGITAANGGSSRANGGVAAGVRDVSFRPQRALACLGTLLIVANLQPTRQQPGAAAVQLSAAGGRRLLLAAAAANTWAAHMPVWTYTVGTVLGYCSSILYLTSRLSQIYRNHRRQSVEGLAISMFLCAIAANSFYGASILVRSYTWAELRSSLPWLIGSLGTVALDLTIFVQSRMFGKLHDQKQHPSDEDEPLLPAP